MFVLRCNLTAVGKGRPRFTRSGLAYTPKKTAEFERKVKNLAKEKMQSEDRSVYAKSIPLKMTVFFYFEPPKSWSKKKRQMCIRGNLPKTTKCDLSNLIKCVEDAFNGVVYEDDSSVAELNLGKYYAEKDAFTVFVERLDMVDDFEECESSEQEEE